MIRLISLTIRAAGGVMHFLSIAAHSRLSGDINAARVANRRLFLLRTMVSLILKEDLVRMSYRLPRYKVSLIKEGSVSAESEKIQTPDDVVVVMAPEYENSVVETAQMLALDTKNKVIGVFTISTGSLSASIIHPRDVFQRAILSNAASVILVHNHREIRRPALKT